ncbi:MAG: 16S rRNA (adenine(1518)-N(6)/adenine(1519)-N(6))-dimethyltransferase RsmA [Erysipelotrichales bacterium]
MDVATKTKTHEILDKYDLLAKKSFGQNFLIDNNIVRNIVKEAQVDKDTCVIEIGPGIGGLTYELAKHAKKVVAIEIDNRMKPVLEDTLSEYDNVDIVFDDFLKIDLVSLVNEHFDKDDQIVVVANLPYYITTAILIKLFEHQSQINLIRISAMMQREVGLRLSAKKDTKDYNSLTILTQYYSKPKLAIKVPKSVFIPAPKVDSVVVSFELIKDQEKPVNEKLFFTLLRLLFKQRRKTILNNLNEYYHDKEKTTKVLNALELDTKLRAENLTLDDIIEMANYIDREES